MAAGSITIFDGVAITFHDTDSRDTATPSNASRSGMYTATAERPAQTHGHVGTLRKFLGTRKRRQTRLECPTTCAAATDDADDAVVAAGSAAAVVGAMGAAGCVGGRALVSTLMICK